MSTGPSASVRLGWPFIVYCSNLSPDVPRVVAGRHFLESQQAKDVQLPGVRGSLNLDLGVCIRAEIVSSGKAASEWRPTQICREVAVPSAVGNLYGAARKMKDARLVHRNGRYRLPPIELMGREHRCLGASC